LPQTNVNRGTERRRFQHAGGGALQCLDVERQWRQLLEVADGIDHEGGARNLEAIGLAQ